MSLLWQQRCEAAVVQPLPCLARLLLASVLLDASLGIVQTFRGVPRAAISLCFGRGVGLINRAAQSFAPESSALGKKHTQIVGPVSGLSSQRRSGARDAGDAPIKQPSP